MTDLGNNPFNDNNWDDDVEFTIVYSERTIPSPMDAEELKVMDKPDRKHCNVCGKIMAQVRCEQHKQANGCNYCHLNKEHKT